MVKGPSVAKLIESEDALIDQMTTPSEAVIAAVSELSGDVMILGIAGKMGPTLGELLVKAGARDVIGVSRFSNSADREDLEGRGIRTVKCDLMDEAGLAELPEASHIFLMAGFKFGTTGNESMTWAMNTMMPARVMERFPRSQIVYVSSGNVYRFVPVTGQGASESDPIDPIGEYAQSRLGGERLAQHYSKKNGTPLAIVRLFYATELRYGIILDIAQKVWNKFPIDLAMGSVNQIWQGDANAYLTRSFPLCESPAYVINMTGKDVLSVRELAQKLGVLMGVEPILEGTASKTALLGDSRTLFERLGEPAVLPDTMVEWVAHWVMKEGRTLGKPTKYESRTGEF